MKKKQHLIKNGDVCCFRCGIAKRDVRRERIKCAAWGRNYTQHIWTSHATKKFISFEEFRKHYA